MATLRRASLLLTGRSAPGGARHVSSLPNMPACSHVPKPYMGPSYDEMVRTRDAHLVPCLKSYYKKPLLMTEGHMQWLFDHTGRRYLDLFGGIVTVSVGHCHPKVTAAATEQMNTLWHTTAIYMHPKIQEYAKRLTDKMPGDLKVVYFVNSGSEANDLAMLLARLYTKQFDIISFRNGYHGMSPYVMGITAHSTWRFDVPVAQGVHHAMNPDPYQGLWGGKHCRDSPVQTTRDCSCAPNECEAADKYYTQLEEVFKYSLPRGKVAGLFAESIQGVGGTVQFPKGFLKKAYELVRINGGLCIADEVQTGFGRTGEHFWGFEGHGVRPDIVTMAKGIGNGFPLAAVVTTPAVAESLGQALHFNTFGGNPVACAVGMAVLDVIQEERLQQNSQVVGTYFLQELARLRDQFPCVGDVRGKGLMIGVEMVNDPVTKAPMNNKHFIDLWEDCKNMGVLLGRGALNGNVLRIKPPMCITKEDVDFGVAVLRKALQTHTEKTKRQPGSS
ncbi:alanine--glyoxylate aminotransferase 2, mitochondrial [Thrips palmi]|uniref:Alanine--glyoxylate aminotransferase 2, mitochondrial n=1 Tax=Thrips palmi TaxID=161013 RepID=A0A6P8Z2S4_THRPL|nr:alanine--glyoxylate aminotransferase 2, mitochondrial [Thrips palmi]